MIKFKKKNDTLILEYIGENKPNWIFERFKNNEDITLRKIFYLTKNNLIETFDALDITNLSCQFKFGNLKGEYYKINKSILGIINDLYIHKDFNMKMKIFVAQYDISIFKHIDKLISEPIYLDGENKNAISYKDFQNLLKNFPNTTEKIKYCQQRLSTVLSQYFETTDDKKEQYERYMNRKISIKGQNLLNKFRNYEKDKYKEILKKMKEMLKNENNYNEGQWQKEIIEILCLLFPKYIKIFSEIEIKDFYKNKTKRPDYLLIDAEGYIDIIEIKRPLDSQIVSKNTYRDNHYPVKELSGSIMQVEKYIFHLNKIGKLGENRLNEKHKSKLPANLKIKITNPGAMIILGRSHNLNEDQKEDFEIIKRKYKNIIDIITYDDLIKRLNHIIEQYNRKK